MAEIYDGGSRSDAARIGGVGLQIVRDWVVRFNACGPDGLIDGKAPANQPKLNDAQREALVSIVESGPTPEVHGVVRWRLIDLAQWLYKEFAISIHETTVSRELKKLGYVKLTDPPEPQLRPGSGFPEEKPPNPSKHRRAAKPGRVSTRSGSIVNVQNGWFLKP